IVGRHAVVHEDERSGDVTIDRVRVVRRKLLVVLSGGRIDGDCWLLELGLEGDRRDELDDALLRRREEDVEALDLRLPAERPELIANPFGVRAIVGRADVVRPSGESLHHCSQPRRVWYRAELRLPLALDARGFGGEAAKG